MSMHAKIATTDSDAPLVHTDRERINEVGIANHAIPVAWFALFDVSSIVRFSGYDDRPEVCLFGDRDAALGRFARRLALIETWFAHRAAKARRWLEAFAYAVEAAGGRNVMLLAHDHEWDQSTIPVLEQLVGTFEGDEANRQRLLSTAWWSLDEVGRPTTNSVPLGYALTGWLSTQAPEGEGVPYGYVGALAEALFEAFAQRPADARRHTPTLSELLGALVDAVRLWAHPGFGLPARVDPRALDSFSLELTVDGGDGPTKVRPSPLPAGVELDQQALGALAVGELLVAMGAPAFLSTIADDACRGRFADGPRELGPLRRLDDGVMAPEVADAGGSDAPAANGAGDAGGSSEARERLAASDTLSVERAASLLDDPAPEVQLALAANTSLPLPWLLKHLATSSNRRVRRAVFQSIKWRAEASEDREANRALLERLHDETSLPDVRRAARELIVAIDQGELWL